jgi:hypothetical protein
MEKTDLGLSSPQCAQVFMNFAFQYHLPTNRLPHRGQGNKLMWIADQPVTIAHGIKAKKTAT